MAKPPAALVSCASTTIVAWVYCAVNPPTNAAMFTGARVATPVKTVRYPVVESKVPMSLRSIPQSAGDDVGEAPPPARQSPCYCWPPE